MSAAKKLEAQGARGPSCGATEMILALRAANWGVRHEYQKREQTGPARPRTRAERHDTLRQWLRKNPTAHAMVATTTHWLYVRNGRVLEDNGYKNTRGRVGVVLWLEPRPGWSRTPRVANTTA